MSTLLTELVRKQVATGLIGMFSKTIDKVVEEIVNDMLRADPEFRKELEQLVRAAFQQTLKELNESKPSS
jgi:BMFP domain-containing protein YqiC